ncbi:uncharacterized protein BXZ73DRAFT_6472, partial [Epithele typhae]|uniref:uncharacterized protein n=1 Tax=Epithele typhae TaxID=378194 RepID=UPI002008CC2D
RSVLLVLPKLDMEIEVAPSRRAPSRHRAEEATLAHALEGIYVALQEPVSPREMKRLNPAQRDQLLRAADERSADGVPRVVDHLGWRRRFLGLRPASRSEVSQADGGRVDDGEVFVVELG